MGRYVLPTRHQVRQVSALMPRARAREELIVHSAQGEIRHFPRASARSDTELTER